MQQESIVSWVGRDRFSGLRGRLKFLQILKTNYDVLGTAVAQNWKDRLHLLQRTKYP